MYVRATKLERATYIATYKETLKRQEKKKKSEIDYAYVFILKAYPNTYFLSMN